MFKKKPREVPKVVSWSEMEEEEEPEEEESEDLLPDLPPQQPQEKRLAPKQKEESKSSSNVLSVSEYADLVDGNLVRALNSLREFRQLYKF